MQRKIGLRRQPGSHRPQKARAKDRIIARKWRREKRLPGVGNHPPKIRTRDDPPAAARSEQARRARLPRLSAAPGPGRDAAGDGAGAGRPRRHLAAIVVVLTMLRAYPGLSGADPRAGGVADAADRRRHHPQSRARRRHQEGAAPDPWPGAAVDGDAAGRGSAGQVPAARRCDRAAAGGRAHRQAQAVIRRWLAKIAADL